MAKTINLNSVAGIVDLTPSMVSNWKQKADAAPVLIINPAATLHQRAALAWVHAIEILSTLEASQFAHGQDPANDRAILSEVINRMHQLEAMLSDIGDRTQELEGGAA